jgi:hypothetical protein
VTSVSVEGQTPTNVTFRDPTPSYTRRQGEDMTKWASLRPFDELERDWTYDACVVVGGVPHLAAGAVRTP